VIPTAHNDGALAYDAERRLTTDEIAKNLSALEYQAAKRGMYLTADQSRQGRLEVGIGRRPRKALEVVELGQRPDRESQKSGTAGVALATKINPPQIALGQPRMRVFKARHVMRMGLPRY
jgi:hypothetical protein